MCSLTPYTPCRFDLPYVELPLHADTLRAWEQPPASSAEGLALPQRNHFIPTDFALKSEAAGSAKDSKAKQAAEALLTAAPAQSAKVGAHITVAGCLLRI